MSTLPFKEFKKEELASNDVIRENSKRGNEVIKISLQKIVVRENFNVRKDYGDIEGLAKSILANGQDVPGLVDALSDGTFVLTDGHRRFEAHKLIESWGNETFFFAIVNGKRTTEEERILQVFTTQDNKQLTPSELAELIKRLINLGHTQSSIAKKIGKTDSYVSQMLSFANESVIIKEEVNKGAISFSTAIQLQKEIPLQSERVTAVKKAIAENDDKKLTTKMITGIDKKQIKFEGLANEIIETYQMPNESFGGLMEIILRNLK